MIIFDSIKKQHKIIILLLSILNLFMLFYAFYFYLDYSFKLDKTEIEEKRENKYSELSIDTSSLALKLEFEILNGITETFVFHDDERFFGTKLSIKYPKSLINSPGDKMRTIRKFGNLDEDGSEFRCVINFQPINEYKGLANQKKILLIEEIVKQQINQLQSLVNNFETRDIVNGVLVATEPASYIEYYFENLKTDRNDKINSMSRTYFFIYNGGVGSVSFFLDSRKLSKDKVINKFEQYKRVISRMVNSLDLYF
jgi:hypothetical protein